MYKVPRKLCTVSATQQPSSDYLQVKLYTGGRWSSCCQDVPRGRSWIPLLCWPKLYSLAGYMQVCSSAGYSGPDPLHLRPKPKASPKRRQNQTWWPLILMAWWLFAIIYFCVLKNMYWKYVLYDMCSMPIHVFVKIFFSYLGI